MLLNKCSLAIILFFLSSFAYSNTHYKDRFYSYNKAVFHFNTKLDHDIVLPVTEFYAKHMPQSIISLVNNFFSNLDDITVFANDVLQLRSDSPITLMRVIVNSTFGLFGLLDIASNIGLVRHSNDFGTTFREYGWKSSNYLVLPFFGPSTVRDALGLLFSLSLAPQNILLQNYIPIVLLLYPINIINMRYNLFLVDGVVDDSLDSYTATRDLYLQSVGEGNVSANINDIMKL